MSDAGPISIAVVCEAEADRRTATGLADRILLERCDWLEDDWIDGCREYRGLEADEPFLRWDKVHELAQHRRIRAQGHFDEKPGAPDSLNARKALFLLIGCKQPPQAVLFIRDSDNEPSRRTGMEQAATEPGRNWQFTIVIGFAHPKRECWVLAGFEPQDNAEQQRFADLRLELGFDPRVDADRLTAKHDADTKSAKRVLAALTQDGRERETRCWNETELEVLRTRGGRTGLSAYLEEVEQRIVPLVAGRKERNA